MARNTYGLDLGSYEIKVYDKKSDTIWKEKNVIAIKEQRDIIAVGDEAFKEGVTAELSAVKINGSKLALAVEEKLEIICLDFAFCIKALFASAFF